MPLRLGIHERKGFGIKWIRCNMSDVDQQCNSRIPGFFSEKSNVKRRKGEIAIVVLAFETYDTGTNSKPDFNKKKKKT